jgi:hypothetical protein
MALMADVVKDPARLKAAVADAAVMLDQEVADKGGITGLGIKAAFGVVKAVKPGIIPEVLEHLLPMWAEKLDPLLAQKPAGTSVSAFLLQRQSDVVNALLSVTDDRAKKATNQTLVSAYNKLRPTGEKHVSAGVPRLSKLVEKHLAAAEAK